MWSSCFATCTVKNQSMFEYGIRIRTRHTLQQAETFGKKCPPDLMERERCYDEKCFTFSWKTSHYVKKTRLLFEFTLCQITKIAFKFL